MASSSASGSAANIEISDIIVHASANIISIKVSIDSTFERNFDLAKGKSKEARLSLAPDRPSLSSSTPLIVKIRLEGVFNRSKRIQINRQDLISNVNEREYRKTVNGIEVVIGFIPSQAVEESHFATDDLRPTTDKIFEICPRFRVLVIGRTGVGKTSLINNTFGVTEAHISHGEVGECDINKELFSVDENKRFVLHDSKGFEPGDEGNFDTVIKFLNDRKEKPDVKDQVHAVWLCFGIPVAGDRLFETGAENFLQSLSEGRLGKMPIVAIFTKYDKLVDHIRIYENFAGRNEKAVIDAKLDELCVRPFREQIRGMTKIPTIEVSSEEEYKWTLHKLTELTTELVGKYLTQDVALLSAVAQQVSPTLKLEAVIAVGKKRYWQGLTSIVNLSGDGPAIVLQNIHQDIVRIWNLQDPRELLDAKEFKVLVSNIVSGGEKDVLSLRKMGTSLSMLAALAGVLTGLSGPAAPIVLPIAAVVVAGHWTILILRHAGMILQRLMTYIVALTIIMQNVFAITTSTNNIVSRRVVKVALKAFLESSQKDIIYSIKEHLHHPGHFGRDSLLRKMTELIELKSNRISADDMAAIRIRLRVFDAASEEDW